VAAGTGVTGDGLTGTGQCATMTPLKKRGPSL